MSNSQPNGDALSVTPILVEDRQLFRSMALLHLVGSARALEKATEEAYQENRRGKCRVSDERAVVAAARYVEQTLNMINQVGWR